MSQVKLTADSGGGTTSLKAPSSTTSNADVVLKLPVADGSANQVLKTDGSGQLSFTSNAGTTINNNADNRIITGSGTASTLNGESSLTWDGNDLSLSGTAPAINFTDTDADDYKIHNVQGLLKITDTTASADRFVINDNGTGYFVSNFQIGAATTSPGATLHLKTSYPSLKIDSGGHASDSYVRMIAGSSENSRVEFGDSDDDDIGMIDYDHANNSMAFKTNTSERMRIDSSGRLLLGTTTEGHPAADDLTISNSGDMGITLRSTDSNQGAIYFSDGTSGDDEYRGIINYNHSSNFFSFFTNASERMRIVSNGEVGINVTDPETYGTGTGFKGLVVQAPSGNNSGITIRSNYAGGGLLAFADGSGSGAERKNLALQASHVNKRLDVLVDNAGVARFTEHGFTPNPSDSAAANAISDYEEGQWTPAVDTTYVSGTPTYHSQTGTYTKIGNRVFVNGNCHINSISFSNNSQIFKITGLPFNGATSSGGAAGTTGSTVFQQLEWVGASNSSYGTNNDVVISPAVNSSNKIVFNICSQDKYYVSELKNEGVDGNQALFRFSFFYQTA